MEGKDTDIQYIWSEENPTGIMTKNTSKADLEMHMERITDGELWELLDTRRENLKKTGVTDDVITHNKTEYSSHALAEVMNGVMTSSDVLDATTLRSEERQAHHV